ncbi:hypothetical protein [Sphingomonas koreensis]
MRENMIDYYRARARREREIVQRCASLAAAGVHRQLAELYEQRAQVLLDQSDPADEKGGKP